MAEAADGREGEPLVVMVAVEVGDVGVHEGADVGFEHLLMM